MIFWEVWEEEELGGNFLAGKKCNIVSTNVDMFTASGVIQLIFLVLVGSFFIITGTRILMLTNRARASTKTRRVSRVIFFSS